MNLSSLLDLAKDGLHPACKKCPWNPSNVDTAFGVSCLEHGVNWKRSKPALSMLIAQDPAGTTPSKTGGLCAVCNSQYFSDKTAQHSFQLWKAAVSLAQSGSAAQKYLKTHYWTNAVMHGMEKPKKEETDLIPFYKPDVASDCCTEILREQINLLSPRVIIGTGKVVCDSLYSLRLISYPWSSFREYFDEQVYCERTYLPSGQSVTVYCTFHAAARTVITHAARLYSGNIENLLTSMIKQLPNSSAATQFLREYPKESSEGRGMRVLLLHWLEIGEGIRRAAAG